MNKKAQVLSIINSRGGSGQSTVSINLAVSLKQESKGRVAVLDFAFENSMLQQIPALLGLEESNSLEKLVLQTPSITPQIIKGFLSTHSSGIEIMTAIDIDKERSCSLTPKDIAATIRSLRYNYDYIIINLREFIMNDNLLSVFDNTQLIFVIVTPEFLSLSSAENELKILHQNNYPPQMIKFILNKTGIEGGLDEKDIKRFFANKLNSEVFYSIPYDSETVIFSANRLEPALTYAARSGFSKAVRELGRYLNDENKKYFSEERKGIFNVEGIPQHTLGAETTVEKEELTDEKNEEKQIDELKRTIHKRLVSELEMTDIDLTSRDPEEKKRLKSVVRERLISLMGEEAAQITDRRKRQELLEEIYNEAVGLGPLEKFLSDPDVTEIMVNNENTIYIEKGGKIYLTDVKFLDRRQLLTIIERIVAPLGRRIDESSPMVDGRLEDGSRVNAIIPPLALNGPTVTIRLFEEERLTTKDLIKFGSLTPEMEEFLSACVKIRKNILIMGGTGSGKTTLLNIVASFIPEDERIVTIEDSAELQLPHEHWIRLESRPPNIEGGGEITIRQLIINSLRMRPDRIVVGECRGGEALDMLQAMNTGHDGSLTTVHANSPEDAIARINTLVLMSGIDLPRQAIMEQIFAAIDIIVHVSRFSDGTRKVVSLNDIIALESGEIKMKKIMGYEQTGIEDEKVVGKYLSYGIEPSFADEIKAKGINLDFNIFKKHEMATGADAIDEVEIEEVKEKKLPVKEEEKKPEVSDEIVEEKKSEVESDILTQAKPCLPVRANRTQTGDYQNIEAEELLK